MFDRYPAASRIPLCPVRLADSEISLRLTVNKSFTRTGSYRRGWRCHYLVPLAQNQSGRLTNCGRWRVTSTGYQFAIRPRPPPRSRNRTAESRTKTSTTTRAITISTKTNTTGKWGFGVMEYWDGLRSLQYSSSSPQFYDRHLEQDDCASAEPQLAGDPRAHATRGVLHDGHQRRHRARHRVG